MDFFGLQLHWFWLSLGIVLIAAEIVVPGFVVFFFGVAALLVGGLCWFFPDISPTAQLAIFILASLFSLFFFRTFFRKTFRGYEDTEGDVNDEFTGRHATVTEAIAPNAPGKVTFNGTDWQAESDQELGVGTRVQITRRNNITLIVNA